MIKKVLICMLIIIAAFLVYVANRPSQFKVSASQTIQAPAEKIFPYINNLHAWNDWSPFEKGIEMKKTYAGPQEGVGSSVQFESNRSGSGTSKIVGSTPPTQVKINLIMTRPLKCNNDIELNLLPEGDSTQVTWTMSGPVGFAGKLMGLVFSDEMVHQQFVKGLNDLKTLVEKK